jgi:hypothetical protein
VTWRDIYPYLLELLAVKGSGIEEISISPEAKKDRIIEVFKQIALKTNHTQAASHFEKSIAILREIKAENDMALAYASCGRFYRQRGDTHRLGNI